MIQQQPFTWEEKYEQPRQHIIKQRHYLLKNVCLVKAMVFPLVMYGCESWTTKSWVRKMWRFWTGVLEKTLSPLDCKEITPLHPKGNQSWIFLGRTDAGAEALIIWPPQAKNWLTRKGPDAGGNWEQEEKGTTEDEILVCIMDLMDMSLTRLQVLVMEREAWCAASVGLQKNGTRMRDWMNWLIGVIDSSWSIVAQNYKTSLFQLEVFKKISLYNLEILIVGINH